MTKSRTDSPATEDLAELQETVERLSQSIDVLTSAVNELADLLQWHINNSRRDELPEPMVVTSLPLDPTSNEWKVNRVRKDSPPAESTPVPRSTAGKLFD